MATNNGVYRTMRLFGLPYQLPEAADPRDSEVSKNIGRNYMKNIISSAPILTIIPGKPKYLKEMSEEDRGTIALSIIDSAGDKLDPLQAKIDEAKRDKRKYRFYDFKRTYTEYMRYVNVLCRACAAFLDIDPDSKSKAMVNEDGVTEDYSFGTPYTKYDWRNYRFLSDKYELSVGTALDSISYFQQYFGSVAEWVEGIFGWDEPSKRNNLNPAEATSWDNNNAMVFATDDPNNTADTDDESDTDEGDMYQNCVQFYVSAEDTSVNESMGNDSSDSQIASLLNDQVNTYVQELKFLLGGDTGEFTEKLAGFTSGAVNGLSALLEGIFGKTVGSVGTQLSAYVNSVGNGENIIFPKIYQKSSYSKSYSFEIKLCAVYGCKLGYYLDVLVPLMHILAFSLPHQTSNNSYTSPFLIKAFCEGHFTCNMGLVSSIRISRATGAEAFNADNIPNEMTVSVEVDDLLSDLMITPQNDPAMFLGNSSLIEYLTTMCCLSVITPNPKKKFEMSAVVVSGMFKEILPTMGGAISEWSDRVATDWFSLSNF